jgi:hypothetical protein
MQIAWIIPRAIKIAEAKDRVPASGNTSQKENQTKDFFDLTKGFPQDTLPVRQSAVLRALGFCNTLIFRFYLH